MARNINDIKSEIAREFMRNEAAAGIYGFEPGAEFGSVFGAASIEFDFAAFGEITGLFYHNDDAEGVSIFQMEAESDDCTARAGYGCEKK